MNSVLAQQQTHQQVPLTTIMIPASAAAQIQSASVQIQQAAAQAMHVNPSQPQILVFMIPYMVNQPPIQQPNIPPTPEHASLNSTLMRHPHNTQSFIRASQQHLSANRTVSSLSNAKQEPEKFYIKANFSYRPTRNKMGLSFNKGDILHVLDTLQKSDYGHQYWLAARVKPNSEYVEKGLIPDKNKAEEIAIDQRALEISEAGGTLDGGSSGVLNASVGRVSFLRRRAAQRSKSLCKDNWDNVVFDIGSFKLPTYERVVYKHPGFCRPVVIFGPLADVAREKLLKDYPEKYSYPSGFNQTSPDHPKVIRLKGIVEVIDQGKHALLDITPSAVEKLNHVNLAPIVIFMKTNSKSIIKEFRSRAAKYLDPNARDEDTLERDGRSSRKLLEQSIKLEKTWFHVFTATLNLSTMGSEMWYRKLRETIENQQSANVWMSEKKADKKLAMASSNGPNEVLVSATSTQAMTANSVNIDNTNALADKFNGSLSIARKSTIDHPSEDIYGNRSHLRNAYNHSLAQKLARALSEPKLNGQMSDREDEDGDDDDELNLKKPFPVEFENSSSVSSSNGATSYGHSSMSGSNMTYHHCPPPQFTRSEQVLNHGGQDIYSMNQVSNGNGNFNSSFNNGSSNYHPLPPMQPPVPQANLQSNNNTNSTNDNGTYHNQAMDKMNNSSSNYVDLARDHETRSSAFQVYGDLNQNDYHYNYNNNNDI